MVNLIRFETNPFDDERGISYPNFQQIASDHLNRLQNNNPGGVFDGVITATQLVYTQFNIVFGSKTVEEALKKGATIDRSLNVDSLLESGRKLEQQVSFLFGKGSSKYVSFFPTGLTELNNASKGDWPTILNRIKVATATNTVALGGTVAADWEAFETTYLAANSGQAGKKGTVDQLRSLLLVDRKAVARQMFINLHTIIIQFIDTPGALTGYFDQSIVDRKQSAATDKKGRFVVIITDHNGNPLAGVLTDIQDNRGQDLLLNLKTDAEGKLKTSPLPTGPITVTFRLSGYVTRTQSYEVFDDQDPENEVQLTRE